MRRLSLGLLFLASIGTVAAMGCFGRTGLFDEDIEAVDGVPLPGPDPDGGIDNGIIIVTDTAAPDTNIPAPVEDARPDRFIDIWEVFPIPEGGPIGDCAGCVRDNCGPQVNACINDPVCARGLGCVVTTCLTGGGGAGGFDFACVTGCFGGDIKTAAKAISTFTCVIGKCGEKCGGLLGGGIPGGPPTADAGKPPVVDAGKPPADASKPPVDAKADTRTDAKPVPGASGSDDPSPSFFEGEWDEARMQSIDPSTRLDFSREAFLPWAREINAACASDLASCAMPIP